MNSKMNQMTAHRDDEIDYVTVTVGEQMLGLPIARVHDVFLPARVTRVPLSRPEIAGVLNLRGRIITMFDMRNRLGLPSLTNGAERMAVGVEFRGEAYGLLVDAVGEVLRLPLSSRDPNPAHLDPSWATVVTGVHPLNGRLMVVLDIDRLLEPPTHALAA
jgi:purine-binding chemotaxis protein CheW